MLQSKHAIKPFYRRLQSFLFVEKSTRIDQNQLKSTKIAQNQPKLVKIDQNGFGSQPESLRVASFFAQNRSCKTQKLVSANCTKLCCI